MPAFGANANPFRSERIERLRYRLDDAGWRTLLDRLTALDHRGALIGPCGSGKTTLLEELRAQLEARGLATTHWRVRREHRTEFQAELTAFLAAAPGRVLLLDGAEQLGWWDWRRVRRASARARGLVITAHRPGRLPTLREFGTTPELLAELVRELTGETDGRDCADLWRRHRGNVRNALRELYDAWGAALPTVPTSASARSARWSVA
jgi:hypothetical protein